MKTTTTTYVPRQRQPGEALPQSASPFVALKLEPVQAVRDGGDDHKLCLSVTSTGQASYFRSHK